MLSKKLSILLIEDNPGDARLIREMLADTGTDWGQLTLATTLAEGRAKLATLSFDVVLLDLSLPDSHGLHTIENVLVTARDTAIVVITGLDDEKIGLSAVNQGAQDYLLKNQVDGNMLVRAMNYAVERKRSQSLLKHYSERLEELVEQRTVQLRTVMEQVQSILDSSSDMILLVAPDGRIDRGNVAFETALPDLLKYGTRPALETLITPAQTGLVKHTLQNVIAEGSGRRLEVMFRRSNTTFFPADLALSPIKEPDSSISGIVCSVRDMTQHKYLENSLRHTLAREQELSDLKSRFITTISHEFRTPLALIQSSTEIMQHYAPRLSEAQRAASFDRIQAGVTRIVSLLDNFLAIDQVGSSDLEVQPTPINITQLVTESVQEVHTTFDSQHAIQLISNGETEEIVLDPTLTGLIIRHLLSNAVKFTPPEAKIAITLDCTPDAVTIQVADCGIGIPKADLESVFDPFYRAPNVGTFPGIGLGLAIVKYAVELQDGTITIESEEKRGTTVTVVLPHLRTSDVSTEFLGDDDPLAPALSD